MTHYYGFVTMVNWKKHHYVTIYNLLMLLFMYTVHSVPFYKALCADKCLKIQYIIKIIILLTTAVKEEI